jgi:hypothetical protein
MRCKGAKAQRHKVKTGFRDQRPGFSNYKPKTRDQKL